MARGTKDINHAQFADDMILLGGASHHVERRFKNELGTYCQASGGKLNLRKSLIYNWNVNTRQMYEISRILGIERLTVWDFFKYPCVPIFKRKQKH